MLLKCRTIILRLLLTLSILLLYWLLLSILLLYGYWLNVDQLLTTPRPDKKAGNSSTDKKSDKPVNWFDHEEKEEPMDAQDTKISKPVSLAIVSTL